MTERDLKTFDDEVADVESSLPDVMVGGISNGVVRDGPHMGSSAVNLFISGNNIVAGGDVDVLDSEFGELEPQQDADWIDRSIPIWKSGRTMTGSEFVSFIESEGWRDDFDMLYITGGEPLMDGWQKPLLSFLEDVSHELDEMPSVVVETNGTMMPNKKFRSFVESFDVHLHLKNSGVDKQFRINQEAIEEFVEIGTERRGWDASFKFTVINRRDLQEVSELCYKLGIPSGLVSIKPPESATEEQYGEVMSMAEQYSFDFKPPLNLVAQFSGTKTQKESEWTRGLKTKQERKVNMARQVNVSDETHAILRVLAARRDTTMKELVDDLVGEEYGDVVDESRLEEVKDE